MASIGAIATADNANKSRKNHTAMDSQMSDDLFHRLSSLDISSEQNRFTKHSFFSRNHNHNEYSLHDVLHRQQPKENSTYSYLKEASVFRPIASD
jgi:hypothetical protein